MTGDEMTPDLAEAQRFLDALDTEAESFTFQTFDDSERKRGALVTTLHGTLEQHADQLAALNAAGAGVFVTVQETDGKGRKATNITRVRAVFADFDPPATAAMPETFEIEPHMIVQSSPGKHHAYWLADDVTGQSFQPLQKAIIRKYGSDPAPCDLPRVMRLPGFHHRKGDTPHMVRMLHEGGGLPYTAERVQATIAAFITGEAPPRDPLPAQADTAPDSAPDGGTSTSGHVVASDRHGDMLDLTRHLAALVVFQGMDKSAAMDALRREKRRGRWTRAVDDGEMWRGLLGAVEKFQSGEWKKPAGMGAEGKPLEPGDTWGFVFADELVAGLGPMRWLVRGLIPEDCTMVLYGPSGTLKSFVMIDVALSLAHGVPWQGHVTKQRSVYYLAGEGQQGFAKRIAAWCQAHELEAPRNFAFRSIPKLRDGEQVGKLVEAITNIAADRDPPGLIIIDTLFTALDGGEENSGGDMGAIIAAMVHIREQFGAAVAAVHHTGKTGDGPRGHSSLPSGMDVMLYAKQGMAPLTVEITNPKQKDGAEHPSMLLQASVVELPIIGEDGEPETSLVLGNPVAAILEGFRSREKVTEEKQAKASARRVAESDADSQIRAMAMEQMAAGASLAEVENAVADLAKTLGFPKLARKKSTLSSWRKELGLS